MKRFNVTVNGTAYDVQVEEINSDSAPVAKAPVAAPAPAPAPAAKPAPAPSPAAAPAASAPVNVSADAVKIISPMPGTILDVKVSVGQQVTHGQPLIVLEAMKMENDIPASKDGTVAAIHVSKGESVDTGSLLVSIN